VCGGADAERKKVGRIPLPPHLSFFFLLQSCPTVGCDPRLLLGFLLCKLIRVLCTSVSLWSLPRFDFKTKWHVADG
jgi:hypothetical protein